MSEFREVIWFYTIALAFALGIFARAFWTITYSETILLVLLAVAVGLAGRGKAPRLAAPGLLLFSLGLFVFALGIMRMDFAQSKAIDATLETLVGNEVTLEGIIRREPEERETNIHLYVDTEYGLLLVSVPQGGDWHYGDQVSFTGKIEKPTSFETDLGRTFNYPGYLLVKRVSYLSSYADVQLVDTRQGNFVIEKIYVAKHLFMLEVERLIPEPSAGLGEGLLLGVKRALGEELESTFRRTGIIHVVVLSGYNIMIVVAFVLFVLGSIFGKKLSSIFGLLGIVLFAVMVGLGATVVRASLMASLLLVAELTGRVYLVLRGLALAGVLMLLWNPYSLAFDVGFQLSFLATFGLITISPYLMDRLGGVPTFAGAREFLVATLATQIFVLPLLLYQIGQFSIVAVIVNVLVLPMVPVAMLLTFITGVAGFIMGAYALPLAFLTHLSLLYIIKIAEWFGALPFAAFTVPAFSFYLVPIGYALIGLTFWWLNREPEALKSWTIVEES